jgi:tetratricopeptide (TPR) repeat protein
MKKTGGLTIIFCLLFFSTLDVSSDCQTPGTDAEKQSAAALIEKGKNARAAGEFDKAAALFKETLRLTKEIKRPHEEAACLINLGITFWDLGQIQEAARYFADAAALFQIQKDGPAESICRRAVEIARFYKLGKDCRSANQNQKSLEFFNKAVDLGRETGIEDFELKCVRQMSLTYWQMGDMEMFFARNKRGLEIAKKINHRKEVGRCLNNIGVYFEKIGDYSNALRNYEMALPILTSELDLDSEAECLNNIGIVYKNLGEFNKALFAISRALEIDNKIGNPLAISTDRGNLGAVYLRRGWVNEDKQDLHEGLKEFDICLDLLHINPSIQVELVALNNLGFAYCLLHEYDHAQKLFSDAMNKIEYQKFPEEYSHLLNNIANVYYENGQLDKAVESFSRSINLSTGTNHLEILWEAYLGLGRCHEARNDRLKALAFYKKSIEAMETIRRRISLDMFKISFARGKLFVYQRALDILHSLYLSSPSEALLEEIFRMAERAKARAFLENLVEANIEDESKTNPELIELEKKISREISTLNREITQPGISETARKEELQELELKEEEYLRLISEIRTEKRAIDGLTLSFNISISKVTCPRLMYHL